jgi:hypothetical protein
MTPVLDKSLTDFLYWHAVSKMRMAAFEDANTVFCLLQSVCPDRTDMAVGRIYCLIRLGQLDLAGELVGILRTRTLIPMEVTLLGRLHRRCEFERARAAKRVHELQRLAKERLAEVKEVRMPHTLGDDQMARLAAEQL